MTNAEKYLKNENYKKTLWYDFKNWCNDTKINCPYGIAFEEFMEQQAKPQLTEDERVILRNIKGADFEKIGRDKIGGLYILVRINIPTAEKWTISFYDHLFQFIKERRRIRNKEIVRR